MTFPSADEQCWLGVQVETPVTLQYEDCCIRECEPALVTTCSDLETEDHAVNESVQSCQGKQNQERAVSTTLYVNDGEQESFQTNYDQKQYASNKSYQDDQDQKQSGSNTIVLDIPVEQNHREPSTTKLAPGDQSYQTKNDNEPTDSLKRGPDTEETKGIKQSNNFCLKLIGMFLLVLMHVTDANSGFSHEPPQEMQEYEGQSISLSYSIKENEKYEYSVLWTKDNNIISNESANYQHYTTIRNPQKNVYMLKIYHLLREDEGTYKCVAIQSEEPDIWVFSSGSYIFITWVPGQQYPKIELNETCHVGEEIVAYCISERIKDSQLELSWFDSPGVQGRRIQNGTHFGITLKINVSEDMNQSSIHCQMIVNRDEPPRTTTSKPINITKQQTTTLSTETSIQSTYTNVPETTKVTIYTLPAQIDDVEVDYLVTYNIILFIVLQLFVVGLMVILFFLRYTFLLRSKSYTNRAENSSLRAEVVEGTPLQEHGA